MLGEAALTEHDAQKYLASYEQAIHSIGKASHGRGIYEGPGISIKLSALHPRYSRAQYERVMDELYPRLLSLTLLAKQYDIGLNIDAEEADRLELSLDLLERLCFEPQLTGWNGIGFVIQAYQKRCPYVIDYVIDLARRSRHRLMIRLVKGAYWDSEIKRAQVEGLEGYPVYTRKVYTDVSYIACARKLLSVPEVIYPQFATHNAHTLSAIYHIAGQNYYPGQYEFQCLHGMGEPLYEQVVGKVSEGKLNRPCRVYAPVGTHETLLAYLVRRLLENGANTSFVNRIADQSISIQELVADPVASIEQMATLEGGFGLPHPRIPLPRDLYGAERANSSGIDLANEHRLASLSCALLATAHNHWKAAPMLGCASSSETACASAEPVRSARRGRPCAGSDRRRRRQRDPVRPERRADLAGHPARRTRRDPGTRRRLDGRRDPAADGPAGSRSRQDLRQRHRRSARSRGLPALLRGAGAQRFHQRRPPPAGPGGVHQPVELPAGDLQWPGRCGAGRRQPGTGQACGANAAGRRSSRALAARSRDSAKACCNCCRAVAKPSAPAWSATSASKA